MPIRREYVSSLYRDLLGREGSDQEIEGHLNNPGGEEGLKNFFLGSPEYTSQRGGTQTWQDVGGQVQPVGETPPPPPITNDQTPPIIPVTPPAQTDIWSSPTTVAPGGNIGNMTGYDLTNWTNPEMQTAKYQVGRIVSKYDLSRSDALDQIVSELRQYFPNVRITDAGSGRINLGQGDADVDIIENYGAANARGAWMPVGGGTGGPSGRPSGRPSGSPSSATERTTDGIANLYRQLGQTYAPPASPGIYKGEVQQAGQDPLSQLITGGLADLILNQGATADGRATMDRLTALIDSGGYLPDPARQRKFESARELMAKGERTALNDARGALASRGLLSEPGNASGAEMSTIGRIQTRNAEEFARNLRDIGIAEDDAANTRLTTALGLATGMATDQARTYLATLGAGSDRQNMLSQIALESLQTNMAWNQFLAQFGLERDKALYAIQTGNIDALMPYLSLFLQLAQTTQRGYV